jgi:hypothetical protein
MTSALEIETSGTVSLVPTSERSLNYPIFIGHDEHYLVVHHHDPPRFEIISSSSLKLVRTIDAFDNCRSVQYKNGLIVSASAQMGTHTRTCCMIRFFYSHYSWIAPSYSSIKLKLIFCCCRLWDVETGLCLREIQEPEPTRYHNINHQIGWDQLNLWFYLLTISYYWFHGHVRFTTNYLVTVPDLPHGKKRVMKIRDLNVAMDSLNQTSTSILLETRDLVSWSNE